MRINIPTSPESLAALGRAVYDKHSALGAASPLNGIEGIEQFGPQTQIAETNHKLAADLYKQAGTATQLRDRALGQAGQMREGTVRYFVTAARDILAGMNKGKEHKLGGWGFDVTEMAASNASPKPQPALKAKAVTS